MNGKQPTLAPRGVETLHPISMKFGRGDYVNKLNKPAKPAKLRLIGQKVTPPQEREIYHWRDLFLGFYFFIFYFLLFILFFFSVTLFDKTYPPMLTYTGSNNEAWSKEVPFGGRITTVQILGSPGPQIPKICPGIGKSQPKLTCRITFKR